MFFKNFQKKFRGEILTCRSATIKRGQFFLSPIHVIRFIVFLEDQRQLFTILSVLYDE